MMMSNCFYCEHIKHLIEISEDSLDVEIPGEIDTNSRASRQIVWKRVVCLSNAVSQA